MKVWYIMLALLLGLSLSACGEGTPVGKGPVETVSFAGMDAQNQYALFNAISFQETDNFYCGGAMTDDHLYYYDKETGISGILCADPSCSHSTSSCGAYVKSGATMFLYDGQRYWITDVNTERNDYVLWKGDMAGTNQTKVKEISFDDIILPYQPQQYAIHRGSIYFLGTADTVSGVDISVRLTLMGSPLDDSETFIALFDQTYDTDASAEVRFVGDCAFLFVQTWTTPGSSDQTVYRIDLNSGATEIVYEDLGGASCSGFWVTEQEEIYFAKRSSVGKVEDGVFVPVVTLKHSEDVVKLMDGIAVSTYLEDDQRCIEIVDLSGNTLYDGKMFTADIPEMDGDPNAYRKYSMLIVGGDANKLIIGLVNYEDEEFYAVLLDMQNDLKPMLLWKVE